MSCTINGTDISLTRGDSMAVKINIKLTDPETGVETTYQPTDGDVVEFHMKRRRKDAVPMLVKTIPNDTLVLSLSSEQTKELDYHTYRYDIQITFPDGSVDTFITDSALTITTEIG